MATAKIGRVMPPRVPGNMGWYESAPLVSNGSLNLNFRNGELYTASPTLATQSSNYYNKEICLGLNIGQKTPMDIPGKYRSMFAKDAMFSDVSSKALPDMTKDEVYAAVFNMWTQKGPWRFICGEAQESGAKTRFQTDYAPNQVRWAYEAITKLAQENPDAGIINSGLMYCTHSTIWPAKSQGGRVADYNSIKSAFDSPAAARALLAAFEWDFNKYWSMELYKTGALPVTNAYNVINDKHTQFWAVILQMELAAKGLEGIFSDPRTMTLFSWARARELQPYTESYPVNMGGGVIMNTLEWPLPDPNLIMRLLRYGFRHGKYVWNWDNPYVFGSNPDLLPEAGDRIGYPNGTGSKKVVNKYNAAPFKAGTEYSFSTAPFGYNDLGAIAGKMHCQQCDFLNKRPTPVQWSIGGVNGPAPDNGYIPFCIDNHKPYILAAVDGNRAIIDGYSPDGKGHAVTVDLGGSFGKVNVDLWPGVDNQLHLTI